MSNRLFQGVIHQMRDAIDRTIGVIDETSVIIACSELGRIGEVNESITAETMASAGTFTINGYTYKSFGNHPTPEYAVFVSGSDSEAVKYANLLAISLGSIKQYYDEKYDRSNFIKNVILDKNCRNVYWSWFARKCNGKIIKSHGYDFCFNLYNGNHCCVQYYWQFFINISY